MITRAITVFILFSLLFVTNGQTNNENVNERTELQKEREAYIIDTFHCKYHISIEFHEKKPFNLKQLIADHKTPEILKDDPRAIKDNEEAFNWLEEVSSEYVISYSMTYIFGTKDKESEEWNPMWVLFMLDDELEIIGHIRYFP